MCSPHQYLYVGQPIEVRYRTGLCDARGNEAHAATYIRRRLIVLDGGLKRQSREHRRILLHELFHFAWLRLGNRRRWSWEQLLQIEWEAGARGEAGWSAEWRKLALSSRDAATRSVKWREYCCESFCDTGAWIVSGEEAELTLGRKLLIRRRNWFEPLLSSPLPI
jgi:hypothetical protein